MSEVNPKPILDINYAFAQTALLVAAIQLHIFTYLAEGALSSESLATVAQISPEATERFLKGLRVLGLIEQFDDGYQLTPLAAQFLVEGKTSYLGGDTLAMLDYLPAWFHLSRTLRTTHPYRDLGKRDIAEKFFAPRVRDLFPLVYPLARRLVAGLDLGEHSRSLRIMDVGAGSAAWSAAFVQSYPASSVVAIDLPAVVAQGRQQIKEMELEQHYSWVEADLTDFSYPSNHYELIILAHVCRFLEDDQARRLLEQLYQSLQDGGVLVLADVFLNVDDISPASAVILDISMLVNTSHGRVRSLGEYQSWSGQCGFRQVYPFNVNGPFPVIIATKGTTVCVE